MSDARGGCPELDERILDSVFAPAPDAPLERHLAVCDRCRRARDLYLRAADGIAGALAAEDVQVAALPRPAPPRRLLVAAAAAAVVVAIAAIGWLAMHEPSPGSRPVGPDAGGGGSGNAAAVPYLAGGGRYVATGEEIRVATQAGALRCREGAFDLRVREEVSLGTQETEMTRGGKTTATVVSVAVISGVVWWATGTGEVALRAGDEAVRRIETAPAAPSETRPSQLTAHAGTITPKPFVESAPEATESSPGPRFELEMVSAEGAPAAGAVAVLFREGVMLDAAQADASGVARFAPRDGTAEVIAAGGFAPPVRERLATLGGRRTLRFGSGAAVAGRVVVDGEPPAEPLQIWIEGEHAFASAEGLPAAVRAALEKAGCGVGSLRQTTGANGTFRFGGLPFDFEGSLSVPWGMSFEGPDPGNRRMAIASPQEDLVLRLHRNPVFTGRVVTAKERVPVPRAQIQELVGIKGGFASTSLVAEDDGRFSIVLYRAGVTRLVLELRDAAGQGLKVLDITEGLDRGRDLGDVELSGQVEIAFRVLDSAGSPIPGAVAVGGPRYEGKSAPTGEDGRGILKPTSESKTLRAAAVGYGSAEIAIPQTPGGELTLHLPRGNAVRVQLRDKDGAVPERLMVLFVCKSGLFPSGQSMDPAHAALGGEPGLASSGPHGLEMKFDPDAKGEVLVAGVKPDVPFNVRAVDRVGGTLAEAEVRVGAVEVKTVELRIPNARRSFRGRVVDGQGRGIVRAHVSFRPTDSMSFSMLSREDGTFEIPDVYSDHVRLDVVREGYVPFQTDALPAPADGAEVPIKLEAGRTVTVRVEDSQGRPVPGIAVSTRVAGMRSIMWTKGYLWSGDSDAAGVVKLTELPLARVTFDAEAGGKTYSVEHDTASESARIVIPVHGSVLVRLDPSRERSGTWRLRLEATGPGNAPTAEVLDREHLQSKDPIRFAKVLPGAYTLHLDRYDEASSEYVPSGVSAPVTVAPDSTAEVTL
jgi:hypothetical protein